MVLPRCVERLKCMAMPLLWPESTDIPWWVIGHTRFWQNLDGTTIPAPVSNLQANSLGAVKHKEANNSLYFPSPDPSFHPHVPYSMYKLLMKGNGNAGSFPHPHHDLSGTGKHHNIRTDFDVADRHPHSRPGPSIASHLGQIPVPSLPLKSPPSPIGRPAHCCLDFSSSFLVYSKHRF